jgi:hypothetical protein
VAVVDVVDVVVVDIVGIYAVLVVVVALVVGVRSMVGRFLEAVFNETPSLL